MLPFNRFLRLTIRFVAIALVTIALVLGTSAIARSQLTSLPTAASNDPRQPPSGVTRLGEYEIAKVRSPLDKNNLFDVVSRTIFNRDDPPEGSLPVEIRAEEITQRLWRASDRTLKAKQTPIVSIAILNNRPILQLRDDRTERPLRLVTVTEPDADYYGKTLDGLAQEWQKILQAEVERIDRLFIPEVLKQRMRQALQIGVGLLLGSGIIWFLWQALTSKQGALEERYQEPMAAAETAIEVGKIDTSEGEAEAEAIARQRSRFLAIIRRQFSLKRQLEIYSFLKWLLLWAFILMWYIGIVVIMSRVPYLMRWSKETLAGPLVLLVLWFFISLAIRIGKSLVDGLTNAWITHPSLTFSESQRIALRAATVSGALKGLVTFVLIALGILWSLDLFDVPTGSILAGGAVIGLAISFGSQSLIKDLVNGCLILMEDQFAVGDAIQIGDKSGLVENLNLRVTQLRNGEGQLITIPNSNISDVCNLTRLWSRIDFSIVVAYDNDPKLVLDVLRQVSQQLYSEPEWRDRLPEKPEVLGIDDLSHTGMLVRVWIKTAPMEQWRVGREFRLRVRQAFEANNIQIGRPQWIAYNTDLAKSPLQN
jgi:moderate conductance mechanosensitive channel